MHSIGWQKLRVILDSVTSKLTSLVTVAFALLALYPASLAIAQEPANVWMEQDRSSVDVGAYYATYDTKFRLSSDQGDAGTIVDIETDFGLDESRTKPFLHANYRFRPRHRLDFAYYDLSRDGTKIIERDIDLGDVSFPEGATIVSKFDYRVAKLTYSYSLLQNQNVDLALAAGIYTAFFDFHAMDIDTGLSEGEDGTAPVPIIGLRVTYLINRRWTANAYLEYFEIDNSNADGRYIDGTVSLEYRFREKTGVGFAYNSVNVEGDDKESDDEGEFKYNGLLLYLFYKFR